jgi:mono/diheme cytochrome c family protein
VQAIVAVATVGWDPATIWREQLNDPDIGSILEEIEAGQHPEWKDPAHRSLSYKSYLA